MKKNLMTLSFCGLLLVLMLALAARIPFWEASVKSFARINQFESRCFPQEFLPISIDRQFLEHLQYQTYANRSGIALMTKEACVIRLRINRVLVHEKQILRLWYASGYDLQSGLGIRVYQSTAENLKPLELLPSFHLSFLLPEEPNLELYFVMRSFAFIEFLPTFFQLLNPEEAIQIDQNSLLLTGLIFGVVFAFSLYNLSLFHFFGKKYLYYYLIYCLSSLYLIYYTFLIERTSNLAVFLFYFANTLVMTSFIDFSISLLENERVSKLRFSIVILLKFLIILALFGVLISDFNTVKYRMLLGPTVTLFGLLMVFQEAKRGHFYASFMVVGCLGLLVAFTLFTIEYLSQKMPPFPWVYPLGVTFEIICFSFAMNHKLKSTELTLRKAIADEKEAHSILAARTAHHLNNPLQCSLGNCEELEHKISWLREAFQASIKGMHEMSIEAQDQARLWLKIFSEAGVSLQDLRHSLMRANEISHELRVVSAVHGVSFSRVAHFHFLEVLGQKLGSDELLSQKIRKLEWEEDKEICELWLEPLSVHRSILYVLREVLSECTQGSCDLNCCWRFDSPDYILLSIGLGSFAITNLKLLDSQELRFARLVLSRYAIQVQLNLEGAHLQSLDLYFSKALPHDLRADFTKNI